MNTNRDQNCQKHRHIPQQQLPIVRNRVREYDPRQLVYLVRGAHEYVRR